MRCDDAEVLIQGQLDAALSPDQERELGAHLRECASCARHARELACLAVELGRLDALAIDDSAWDRAVQAALRPQRRTARVWVPVAAAAVLAALVWLAAAKWPWAPEPNTAAPAVAHQPSPPGAGDPAAPTPQVALAGAHDHEPAKMPVAGASTSTISTATPPTHRPRPPHKRPPKGPVLSEEPAPPPAVPSPGPVPYAPEDLHTLPTAHLVAVAEGLRLEPIEEELVRVAILRMADVPPEAMLSPRQLMQLAGNPLDPPPEIASAANTGEE